MASARWIDLPALASPGVTTRPRPIDRLMLLFPALALALVAVPARYHVTLAEPDLVRMMAAFVYGGASGSRLDAGMHYGESFSFGYYELLYALAPAAALRDPDLVAALMNGFGVCAGLLCAWACTAYFNRLFGPVAALLTAAIFFLSPMMLPVALSGHPLIPAAACFFAAGLLLERATGWSWLLAAALIVAGLSLRAEVALALPFLCIAGAKRQVLPKALLILAAGMVFAVLQHRYAAADGGAGAKLVRYVQSFLSLSHVGRGVVILVLGAGLATAIGAAFVALRRRWSAGLFLPLVLGLPALIAWLPNPHPARHLFFPVLALCLLLGLRVSARLATTPARAALAAIVIIAANQIAAELARPLIVPHYTWSYPEVAGRRATQRVPLGAFALDQRANKERASRERREAIALASHAPRRLVILGDSQHYLIAHLIAADPGLKWSESAWNGLVLTELASAQRTIVLIEKSRGWPRDVTAEALDEAAWKDWPVYQQPSTVSRYDKTPVPAARKLDLALRF